MYRTGVPGPKSKSANHHLERNSQLSGYFWGKNRHFHDFAGVLPPISYQLRILHRTLTRMKETRGETNGLTLQQVVLLHNFDGWNFVRFCPDSVRFFRICPVLSGFVRFCPMLAS